jgi:hypothetical protein
LSEFLLFINDVSFLKIGAKITLYADDTCLTWKNINVNALEININNDLIVLKEWFDRNRLCLNIQKTNILLYKNCETLNVKIHKDSIKQVNSQKFLGITVDKNLKWDDHIDALVSKLSSACYAYHL